MLNFLQLLQGLQEEYLVDQFGRQAGTEVVECQVEDLDSHLLEALFR